MSERRVPCWKEVEKLPAPVSVELDKEYCDKMKNRGISVTCESITDLDEHTMPISDYYFWWPMAGWHTSRTNTRVTRELERRLDFINKQ